MDRWLSFKVKAVPGSPFLLTQIRLAFAAAVAAPALGKREEELLNLIKTTPTTCSHRLSAQISQALG